MCMLMCVCPTRPRDPVFRSMLTHVFTLHRSYSLTCVKDYLAIDSGVNICTHINCDITEHIPEKLRCCLIEQEQSAWSVLITDHCYIRTDHVRCCCRTLLLYVVVVHCCCTLLYIVVVARRRVRRRAVCGRTRTSPRKRAPSTSRTLPPCGPT